MANPNPDAAKSRILNHMNADHSNSLRLYARHYSQLPLPHAKTAKADDITLDHLILQTSFGRVLIPFTPPLKSFSEARERLVGMHEECLTKLGVDGVMLTEYRLPNRLWQWGMVGISLWNFGTLPFRESILPSSGSWISQVWSLGGLLPGLAKLTYTLAPATLWFMIVMHAGEAVYMGTTVMRRYEVEIFSGVWWAWVLDTATEGFGSFVRLEGLVREIKEAKEKGRPQGLGRGKH